MEEKEFLKKQNIFKSRIEARLVTENIKTINRNNNTADNKESLKMNKYFQINNLA